jgi:hypothetical protein
MNAARRDDERKGAAGVDQEYDLRCILDPDAGASAVLLRDIHAALLKVSSGSVLLAAHMWLSKAKQDVFFAACYRGGPLLGFACRQLMASTPRRSMTSQQLPS